MGIRIELNDGTYFLSDNPKEELMNILVKKTTEAGHLLTFDEANSDLTMIQPNFYAFYYGSFSEAAQIAWKRATTRLSRTAQSEKERAYMSANYSFETIKGQLIDYYNEYGRLPTQSEIMSNPDFPSWTTMIKFLGPKSGWAQLLPPVAEAHTADLPSDELLNDGHSKSPSSSDESTVPALEDETEALAEQEIVPVVEPTLDTPDAPTNLNTNDVKINTSKHQTEDAITIEVKLSLPHRDKPVLFTLTV